MDSFACSIQPVTDFFARSVTIMRDNRAMIEKRDFIEGAAKAIAVLESFSAERQRINATQAAERAGLTRAAARRYLLTLAELGYLQTEDGYFWLAPRALRLTGAYLSSARLPKAVQLVLNRLAKETGQAFSVAVLDGSEVVIVARSGEHRTSSQVMPYGIHLGARLPAFATSTGRAILASMSKDQVELFFKSYGLATFRRLTPRTVASKAALLRDLRSIQQKGYAEVDGEHEIGVRALAVTLSDAQGNVQGAINIVESTDQNSRKSLKDLYFKRLREAAEEIRFQL